MSNGHDEPHMDQEQPSEDVLAKPVTHSPVKPSNVIPFPLRTVEDALSAAQEEIAATLPVFSEVTTERRTMARLYRFESTEETESYLASLKPLVDLEALESENNALRQRLLATVDRLHQALKGQPVIAKVLSEWEWTYFVEPEQLKHPWGIYHSQEKLPSEYALLPFEFIRCVTLQDEIERINALLNRIGLLLSLPVRKDNRQRRYELAIRGSWLYALKQRLYKDLGQAEGALAARYEPIWKKWKAGMHGVQETMRALVHKPKFE